MKSSVWPTRLILFIALLGLLNSAHLWTQQQQGFEKECLGFELTEAVDNAFDCASVVNSDAGTFLGFKNSTLGLLFYMLIITLTIGQIYVSKEIASQLNLARSVVLGTGFLYSLYLVYLQFFVLDALCLLCLISALCVTAMTFIQFTKLSKAEMPTNSSPESEKNILSIVLFIMMAVIGADLYAFWPADAPVTPKEEITELTDCFYNPEYPAIEDYASLVSFTDFTIGNPDSDVMVVEYFDTNCPHCKHLYPVMEEVIEARKDDVQFFFIPFRIFRQSGLQTQALYEAARQGKFQEMLHEQFVRQDPQNGLGMAILLNIADQIGMDRAALQTALEEQKYAATMATDINRARAAGVNRLPTVMINGKVVHTESRTTDCLTKMIDAAGGK